MSVVQQATITLGGDDTATRLIVDAQSGPDVLVGHSYGGAVISQAGTHRNLAALVYIAAFAPDEGESVDGLIAGFPADSPQPTASRPRTGSFSLTARGSMQHSLPMCRSTRPPSWPTHKCRGDSKPLPQR